MTKAEQIMKMVEEGKTFQEIVDSGQKEKFIQITLGKNGYDWKTMKPKEESKPNQEDDKAVTSNGTGYGANPFHEEPNPEVSAKAKALAEAIKHCPELLKDSVLVQQAQEIQAPKAELRVQVSKCTRHYDVDVKPGENCPKCVQSSINYEKLANARNHAPPCPKCGRTEIYRMFENGGVIKVLSKKAGHYSCGSCQISYNVRGEQTEWGENDAKFFA